MSEWLRVTKTARCLVCEHAEWCGILSDGSAAICMRVPSSHETKNGGWLHPLGPTTKPMPLPPPRPKPAAAKDWLSFLLRQSARTDRLAAELGVSTNSLQRLSTVRVGRSDVWAFPMRSERGEVIGVRLRASTGRKWAIRGSRQGLFLPDGALPDVAGKVKSDPVVVCEGPTDTAAALDWGLCAVGRPSCAGGLGMLVPLLQRRHVVVLADRGDVVLGVGELQERLLGVVTLIQ